MIILTISMREPNNAMCTLVWWAYIHMLLVVVLWFQNHVDKTSYCWRWWIVLQSIYSWIQVACPIMEKQQSKLTNQMQAILKCHQVWRIWLFSLVLHFSAMGQATWNQLYLNLKWVGCVHVTLFQWWSPSYSEQIAVCLYCLCKRPIKHFICIRVKSKRTVHTASYRGYRLVVDNLRVISYRFIAVWQWWTGKVLSLKHSINFKGVQNVSRWVNELRRCAVHWEWKQWWRLRTLSEAD